MARVNFSLSFINCLSGLLLLRAEHYASSLVGLGIGNHEFIGQTTDLCAVVMILGNLDHSFSTYAKFFRKTNVSYHLLRTRMCA